MIGLGRRELELLELLVEAERENPSERFFVISTAGGNWLRQDVPGGQKQIGETLDLAALTGLDNAGLLNVTRYTTLGPALFFMPSGAEQALEALRAELGKPTPLGAAEARAAELEARIERGQVARRTAARRFGRAVRWIVLPLALVAVGLIAWATAGPGAGIGALVILGVVYAVITTGLGISGLQLARRAEDAAARWAERRLTSWTDPGAD